MLTSYLLVSTLLCHVTLTSFYRLIRGVDDSLAKRHITLKKELEESEYANEYESEQPLADDEL